MLMTLDQFQALSREERDKAIYAQNEATREMVNVDGHAIGFTYQTLGGFYRAYSYRNGTSTGPHANRAAAITYVESTKPVPNYSRV